MAAFDVPQWATFVVAGFSFLGVIYTGLKTRQTADAVAKLNENLKVFEHRLNYRAILLKRRMETYEELNDLIGMFFIGMRDFDEIGKELDVKILAAQSLTYAHKLEAFDRKALYLNRPVRAHVERFITLAVAYATGEKTGVASLYDSMYQLGRIIQTHIVNDLRTLYDFKHWEVDDLLRGEHLAEPPVLD